MPTHPARPTRSSERLRTERWSQLGFLALFVLVPLVYMGNLYTFDLLPKRLLVQIALLALSVSFLIDLRAGRIPGFHKTRFNLPVLVYLTLSVLAFAQALNPVAALIDLSHQLTFALLFLILVATFPAASISSLLRAAAVVGIAVSVLGILESRGVPMGWLPSSGRPSATFGYRNFAASFLVMNIPLALALWLTVEAALALRRGGPELAPGAPVGQAPP